MSLAATAFAPYETGGPTLLAQTPPTPRKELVEDDQDWGDIFNHLESRLGGLRMWRWSWWVYWGTLARYILPRRYRWLITANLFNKGGPINQEIIDSTASLAVNVCAPGLVDGMMPTTRKWFKLGIGIPGVEPDTEAKMWLEDTETKAEAVFAGSNFYTIMAQAAEDEVVFGTAVVIEYEDSEDIVRFYNPCAGEYYLGTGFRFSVDTFYREFVLTTSQVVEMFGLDDCPPEVQMLWRTGGGSLENEFVVAHAVEPNFPIQPRGRRSMIEPVPGGFAFREFYWLRGKRTPKPLSRRGFHEKPFAVARWKTTANDAYGRSPCMDALGDCQQLQMMTRRGQEAVEKQVRPPMGADATLKNEPTSILPGHVTFMNVKGDGKQQFFPLYEVEPKLGELNLTIKEIQGRIDRALMVDVFQAISEMEGVQPRNELEIAERKGEKLQRLGPVIGNWKTEFAQPLVTRLISIMERRRLLKPLPKSLRGVPLKIDYIDMVTLAQRGAKTAVMERTFATAGSLSQAAKAAGVADPIRTMNLDKSLATYAEDVDFPADCFFTPEQVRQHDQMRNQMAKQNQATQTALAAAKASPAAVQAATGLSQLQVGGGQSALAALTGQGAGGVQ